MNIQKGWIQQKCSYLYEVKNTAADVEDVFLCVWISSFNSITHEKSWIWMNVDVLCC